MASPHIVTLTQDNFQKEVIESTLPILVDFWAEWCGPCKMIAPILDELAEDNANRARIGKVDIDQHQMLAAQYGITAIPTILLFHKGQVVDQVRGLRSKRELQASIDRVLS